MSRALVFSIEEFSVFDGPGIRTSVFIMGCPLRCEWCHNPEGQSFENFILRAPNGCLNCGNCLKFAANDGGRTVFTEKSIKNCPNALLRYCGTEYTSEELCAKLEKNIPMLNAAGGGITFSGGEPTSNPKFLLDCLSLLKGKTNRAVQTCGYCSPSIFEKVLDNSDYMLFDIKSEKCHGRRKRSSMNPHDFRTSRKMSDIDRKYSHVYRSGLKAHRKTYSNLKVFSYVTKYTLCETKCSGKCLYFENCV